MDCCSKNCLTYSYKCIRNLQQYPYYYYGSEIVPPKPVEIPGISLDDLLFKAFPSRSYDDYKPTRGDGEGTEEATTTNVVLNDASGASTVDNRLGEEAQLLEAKPDNTCLRVGEKVRTFGNYFLNFMSYFEFLVLQTQRMLHREMSWILTSMCHIIMKSGAEPENTFFIK